MIANLMMYARPELAGAHERFWAMIRSELDARGVDSPATLAQDAEEFSVWRDPALVLSQTCGMPYRVHLKDSVQLVGTPDYGLADCAPGYYRSALVVRADDPRQYIGDFRSAVFAYNMTLSQSGWAAPYWHAHAKGFWFETRVQSHGHVNSARMVVSGEADIASLDAVTWRMIERHENFATDLRVLEWTAPTPGLPYITGPDADAERMYEAIVAAIERLAAADRAALSLEGLVQIPQDAYLAVPNPPTSATV